MAVAQSGDGTSGLGGRRSPVGLRMIWQTSPRVQRALRIAIAVRAAGIFGLGVVVGYIGGFAGSDWAVPVMLAVAVVYGLIENTRVVSHWISEFGAASVWIDGDRIIVQGKEDSLVAELSGVRRVVVSPGVDWADLLYPRRNGDALPRLRVIGAHPWTSPPLLLWKGEHESLEHSISRELARCGYVGK